MILAAGVLVLLGLGLFVAGILTGMNALYWGCVAVCVVAAGLLVLARRQLGSAAGTGPASAPAATDPLAAGPPVAAGGAADGEPSAAATASGTGRTTRAPAAAAPTAAPEELADPPVEEVEVTDLLLVVDLKDEVIVIDEHPRYHLAGCLHLTGRTTIPMPLDQARGDGFTPCAVCAPDRNLAERARARKAAGGS